MDIEENTTVMDDVEFLKRKYLLFFYVAVLLWTLCFFYEAIFI